MLVYIKQDLRHKILKPNSDEEIPEPLCKFFKQENDLLDKMQKELDVENECGIVYLLSQEIV